MNKFVSSNIKQLSKLLQENTIDSLAVTEKSLDNVRKNKNLNNFITICNDLALKSAEESSKRYSCGKSLHALDGIPIAVKDNFCTKGVATTCASRMLEHFVPTYNATVFDKLHKLGAVLIGKTNMDQFAMGSGAIDSIFGPTRNVWNTDEENWHIAGGSSGGSAVAVASGSCFAALGSDTGGSTRNPASYCGVIGLKPTYGLLSRYGLIPLVNSMDVPGIITRTVDDCAVVLNAIAGPDPLDSTTIKSPYVPVRLSQIDEISLKGLKVGIPIEYHCEGLHQNVFEIWTKVADMLENAGAEVNQVSLPNTAASIFVYSILNQCEVSSNMSRYDGIEFGHRSDENSSTEQLYAKTRAEGFNGVVKNRILAGNYFLLRRNYDKYFQKALQVRRLISNDFKRVFDKGIQILLTPTTLTEAPFYKEFIKSTNRDQCAVQDFCTQPANMAGIPAISLPIRLSENKLPLSLQLMGPNLSEQLLLTVAKWIENQVQFPYMTNIK